MSNTPACSYIPPCRWHLLSAHQQNCRCQAPPACCPSTDCSSPVGSAGLAPHQPAAHPQETVHKQAWPTDVTGWHQLQDVMDVWQLQGFSLGIQHQTEWYTTQHVTAHVQAVWIALAAPRVPDLVLSAAVLQSSRYWGVPRPMLSRSVPTV